MYHSLLQYTGATCGAKGSAYSSKTSDIISSFSRVHLAQALMSCVVYCVLLFVGLHNAISVLLMFLDKMGF